MLGIVRKIIEQNADKNFVIVPACSMYLFSELLKDNVNCKFTRQRVAQQKAKEKQETELLKKLPTAVEWLKAEIKDKYGDLYASYRKSFVAKMRKERLTGAPPSNMTTHDIIRMIDPTIDIAFVERTSDKVWNYYQQDWIKLRSTLDLAGKPDWEPSDIGPVFLYGDRLTQEEKKAIRIHMAVSLIIEKKLC